MVSFLYFCPAYTLLSVIFLYKIKALTILAKVMIPDYNTPKQQETNSFMSCQSIKWKVSPRLNCVNHISIETIK